jgi:hypothetical protein
MRQDSRVCKSLTAIAGHVLRPTNAMIDDVFIDLLNTTNTHILYARFFDPFWVDR